MVAFEFGISLDFRSTSNYISTYFIFLTIFFLNFRFCKYIVSFDIQPVLLLFKSSFSQVLFPRIPSVSLYLKSFTTPLKFCHLLFSHLLLFFDTFRLCLVREGPLTPTFMKFYPQLILSCMCGYYEEMLKTVKPGIPRTMLQR